jgi:adenine-specific DNA methylase
MEKHILLTYNHSRVEANLNVLSELLVSHPNSDILKRYSGWGGLRHAIYDPSVYQKMKKIISEADLISLKKTLKTAYYTPSVIVNFIYKTLTKWHCCPNKILEPSAGHGVFIDLMPIKMREDAQITAVEIDAISNTILSKLYPDINVFPHGFEQFHENEFDLIIGNPPFGQLTVSDANHLDLSPFSIHHYFVAKSMRLLKQGGMLAMVLPRYFLDNRHKHVRNMIANEGGSLVAAFRLPDNLFNDAKVTVDVVFLKKVSGDREWLHVEKVSRGERFAFLNRYFYSHRQHVFGKLKFISVYGRTEITCQPFVKTEK